MSNFKPKKSVPHNDATSINVNILRPPQQKYLYQQVLDAVKASYQTKDDRIMVVHAPTNSGKTFSLVNVTIPALIQQNPHTTTVVYTSPDSGCVDGPYNKFREMWHNKIIVNCLGIRVRIRVLNGELFNISLNSDDDIISDIPVVEVVFITTAMMGRKWGDYLTTPSAACNLTVPTFIIVDEIHYGMGTVSWETIKEDQGRTNNNYDPHWLPILTRLSQLGTRVVGFTGTPTNSQAGNTSLGKTTFNQLLAMPKVKDETAFVDGWTLPNTQFTYQYSKLRIEEDLVKLQNIFSRITAEAWTKARFIGITKIMPGALFKFARTNSLTGVSLEESLTGFNNWARQLGADYGTVTCTRKEYQKSGTTLYRNAVIKRAVEAIERANDPVNFSVPVMLSVVQQGNMGWDIPRIKYITALSHPSGKDITNMQEQLMARGNRLPFENMSSHATMANQIASLELPVEQRKALAEYVVFMCSTVIYFSRGSELLKKAFTEFKRDTHTSAEGMAIYMDAIAKCNTIQFRAPKFTSGYSAGSKNQAYKKYYCEACTKAGSIDPVTGITLCEREARKVREFERGQAFTESEWKQTWFHSLALDHANGNRTDYSLENLITRCPTNNGVKTYDAGDYLNKYDKNGNRVLTNPIAQNS